MKGDLVTAPSGEVIELADIGLSRLLDDEIVRIWDVSLAPGECHPWHLHHNPYVVLSLQGSDGRMDWLDGSPPRYLSEYRGGAVYRPISPVHRLTNIGEHFYRNRLIELKDLGEHRKEPLDIGNGGRSTRGAVLGPPTADGRVAVLVHEHVSIWTVEIPASMHRELNLKAVPHVLSWIDLLDDSGVSVHQGGSLKVSNPAAHPRTLFVLELSYLEPVR
ncbi:cupin domain-containing protein [Kineosporia babensis]|uniref:Cupin n=1 Tax=Kineosporia babensis TaxID=499548 RepID=A0A9X1NGP7_9ACTN|nr:hypothetical protein [Kineosporia babensis]MCD5314792.1 hypothetical protein [Kineosporia babensis]